VDRQLDLLTADLGAGVRGCFTTRHGGASTGPWAQLNLAFHVDDVAGDVRANRALLASRFGAAVSFPEQVHGASVRVIERPTDPGEPFEPEGTGADALITRVPAVPLGVLCADCLPVLLADASEGVVGVAHAGRRGLAGGVLQATVEAMIELGGSAARMTAVVGPAVCGRCYEVPAVMRDEVSSVVPASTATTRRGTPSLDLVAGAVAILTRAGVANVVAMGICTVEDVRFYSYRRDGRGGRFAGVVMLEPA
jgi:hypothetical protein